jgi:hypothetical protein
MVALSKPVNKHSPIRKETKTIIVANEPTINFGIFFPSIPLIAAPIKGKEIKVNNNRSFPIFLTV